MRAPLLLVVLLATAPGCVTGGAPDPAGTSGFDPPPLRERTFAFEGTLGTFAQACVMATSPPACHEGSILDATRTFVLDHAGPLHGIGFELAWEARTALTSDLSILYGWCEGEGDDRACPFVERAEGASPIRVELPDVEVPATGVWDFSVSRAADAPPGMPAETYAESEQPFTIRGVAFEVGR